MKERLEINPEILKWSREFVNLPAEQFAQKLSWDLQKYLDLESGERLPTFKQLQTIGKIVGRSWTFFFRQDIPDEKPPHIEMRRTWDSINENAYDFAIELQEMLEHRDWAVELHERLEEPFTYSLFTCTIKDDPKIIAERLRDILDKDRRSLTFFTFELKNWVNAIEEAGILVFKLAKTPIEQVRGFAYADKKLPLIATNKEDSENGEVFTLIHEVAHLLLGETGITNNTNFWQTKDPLEKWCNQVAVQLLLPEEKVKNAIDKSHITSYNIEGVDTISKKLKVSPSAVTRRLCEMGIIDEQEKTKLVKIFDIRKKDKAKIKEGSGGIATPRHLLLVSTRGKYLPKLALTAHNYEMLSTRDLAKLLKIKVEKIPDVQHFFFK